VRAAKAAKSAAKAAAATAATAAAAAVLAFATAVVALAGCGGGVGEGGTGYASGPITGFGSVIVNDIVFDDAAAQIEDGEGTARPRAELRLGMTVEVESEAIRDGAARATRVRFDSAVRGPVERVDADSFVVLGQRVAVDETTVYDNALAAGLPALATALGQVVEVYGLFDAGLGRFRATRVELRPLALVYRLRGVVSEIDERARTLRIGTAVFGYAAASAVPSNLAVGSFVRLWVATDQILGRWPVLRFGEVQRELGDVDGVSVKGFVTSLASATDLRVDGRLVDARAATVSGGPLTLGLRVEVIGSLRGGVLVASSVLVRSDQFERERGFELRGEIESVAADRLSLVLRGVTVSLARPPSYDNGSAADLAAGRSVEVRGVVSVGNGARLDAVRVRFR
jgi:hypothetical protein